MCQPSFFILHMLTALIYVFEGCTRGKQRSVISVDCDAVHVISLRQNLAACSFMLEFEVVSVNLRGYFCSSHL